MYLWSWCYTYGVVVDRVANRVVADRAIVKVVINRVVINLVVVKPLPLLIYFIFS